MKPLHRLNKSYTNSKDGAYVKRPKFYYKGYVAEDESGNPTDVSKGDRNRIRIGLKTTNTPALLKVWYSFPWWMSAATILSFAIWLATPVILAIRINKRISINDHRYNCHIVVLYVWGRDAL